MPGDGSGQNGSGSMNSAGLIAAVALAVAAVVLTALVCVRATGGTLIYALDDAYIHLAMGRTLAESGIWGVNAQTPGAASSSPIWTLLLAGMSAVVGAQTWLPLALNVIAAAALAAAADLWLRELALRPWHRFGMIAVIIIIGPLGPLAMTGMEHVAHAAAVLLMTWLALRSRPSGPPALALAAALAMGLRYESGFVAAGLALVLALRRDWRCALALIIGPAVVVIAMGLWQVSMGEGLLPNSLAVKAVGSITSSPGAWLRWKIYGAMEHAFETPVVVLPLLALIGALVAAGMSREDEEGSLPRIAAESAAALAVATLLHITLARTGWYHRYEAYLLIWGVVAVCAGGAAVRARGAPGYLGDRPRPALRLGIAAVAVLVLLGFGLRINAYMTAPEACGEIYRQQCQMARFVKRHYANAPIVVHDIGYVAWLSDSPLLDMGGLASHHVIEAKSQGRLDSEMARRLAGEHGARIAISYPHEWVPEAWRKVASWRIDSERVVGNDTVFFYAIREAPDRLLDQLREFESALPPGITVSHDREWAGATDRGSTRPSER